MDAPFAGISPSRRRQNLPKNCSKATAVKRSSSSFYLGRGRNNEKGCTTLLCSIEPASWPGKTCRNRCEVYQDSGWFEWHRSANPRRLGDHGLSGHAFGPPCDSAVVYRDD